MKVITGILLLLYICCGAAFAQTLPVGLWKTVDDKTGEAKSYVEIYEKDGKIHGKVAQLLQRSADTVCEKCPGNRKNKPLVGMVIVSNLEFSKGVWKNGSILDPESGNEYACSIWLEANKPDELKVRGRHWTGLYRTQTWYRAK